MFIYRSFLFFLYTPNLAYFDPSGHFLCAIVSYGNWALLINFIQDVQELATKGVVEQYSMTDAAVAKQLMRMNLLNVLTAIQYAGIALTFYQVFTSIFTGYAFHTVIETILGYLAGVFTAFVCLECKWI